jgi:hypothetical protein
MSAVRSSGPVPCAMLMQTALPTCPPHVTDNDTFVQYSKTKVRVLSENCPVTFILFVSERLSHRRYIAYRHNLTDVCNVGVIRG